MAALKRSARISIAVLVCILVFGCASTTVTLQPSPQLPICSPSANALVVWATQWRPDQKDVRAREEAAAIGIEEFLAQSGCFAHSELRRVADLTQPTVRSQLATAPASFTRFVGIEVRELGPTVKLLSSAAFVEGGTEAVFQVVAYSPDSGTEQRQYLVHWRNGGPGVIKGVAGLPVDMQAALRAGLQPPSAQK